MIKASNSDQPQLTVIHPSLGKVNLVSVKQRYQFPGVDPIVTCQATISHGGSRYRVPLFDLWYYDKPLPSLVIDYERGLTKAEQSLPEERYLHSAYGIVVVVERYDNSNWLCRITSNVEVESPLKFAINPDEYLHEQSLDYTTLKEFQCHPSELVPINNLKELKPKDSHLYSYYRQSMSDDEYLDEFVYVVADLPRLNYKLHISTRCGMKYVIRKRSPKVLVRSEDTGKFYILPAYSLWRVSGEFKTNNYGEKIAERYHWREPNVKAPKPFIPDDFDGELNHKQINKTTFYSLNRKAWYWKLPPVSAKQLGFSEINVNWCSSGNQVATIQVEYQGREYKVPIYISSNKELKVKVRSRQVAAFLCRYVSAKQAQLSPGGSQL